MGKYSMSAYGKVNTVFVPEEYKEIFVNKAKWHKYTRKAYEVMIQTAKADKVYNVEAKPGFVFNKFEQSEVNVANYDYVVTGVAGEMWPIYKSSLLGYEATQEQIKAHPEPFKTRTNGVTYFAFQIPANKEFRVELSSGEILKGNVNGIEHGDGDYIVCTDFEAKDYRIVNGAIFGNMYQER